jgi:ATPase subunit of ABC transporter with duplicated ATPase domains
VALAALLIGEWEVIALDEPTNHLDVEGIAWLAAHVKNRRWPKNSGGLLVVTHDRWFLDEVCTETWEVHDGIVEPFEGGYAAYVLQRVERDRIAAATEAKRHEPDAQGAGLAAPRGAGAHEQAEVPHRGGQPADRGRAPAPQPDRAATARGDAAGPATSSTSRAPGCGTATARCCGT